MLGGGGAGGGGDDDDTSPGDGRDAEVSDETQSSALKHNILAELCVTQRRQRRA